MLLYQQSKEMGRRNTIQIVAEWQEELGRPKDTSKAV
jgi:hypothetical protein